MPLAGDTTGPVRAPLLELDDDATQRVDRARRARDASRTMSTATLLEYRNLVGGELVDAVDGATREIVNPATGDVIGRVPEGTQADVERALAAARAARVGWRDTTPGQRMEALLALADTASRPRSGRATWDGR